MGSSFVPVRLAPSIVPRKACLRAPKGPAGRNGGPDPERQHLANGIEVCLPRARKQRVVVQNHDRPPPTACESFEPPEQIDLLGCVQLLGEPRSEERRVGTECRCREGKWEPR